MGLLEPLGQTATPDEAAIAASEFQETVRDELMEAAANIVEKMAELDWYDLSLRGCRLTLGARGKCERLNLDIMVRGKRMHLDTRLKGSGRLAALLEEKARLKWPVERDPLTGKVKGGRAEGMAALEAAMRAAKAVWALADAVTRYPGVAEPQVLLKLIDGLRFSCRRNPSKAARSARLFLSRLGKAAGLGGARGAHKAYKGLILTERGAALLADESAKRLLVARKALLKVREKVREEAEKTGLLMPPGAALELGLALDLGALPDPGPLPDLPPVPAGTGPEDDDF